MAHTAKGTNKPEKAKKILVKEYRKGPLNAWTSLTQLQREASENQMQQMNVAFTEKVSLTGKKIKCQLKSPSPQPLSFLCNCKLDFWQKSSILEDTECFRVQLGIKKEVGIEFFEVKNSGGGLQILNRTDCLNLKQ